MSYLLDTFVVSELSRPRPDPGVVAWMSEADDRRIQDQIDRWLRRFLRIGSSPAEVRSNVSLPTKIGS